MKLRSKLRLTLRQNKSFIKTFACRLNEEGIAYSDKLIDLKNSYAPVLKSFGATEDLIIILSDM